MTAHVRRFFLEAFSGRAASAFIAASLLLAVALFAG